MTALDVTLASEIAVGSYVCVRTKSKFLGPVICWATGSWADHAFLVGPKGTIIQAAFTGVEYAHLSDYAGCKAVVNSGEPMTARQRELVWRHATTLVGAGYDYPDLASIALGELGWHWQWLIRFLGGRHAFICSQVVALCGAYAGLKSWLCGQEASDLVTPALLAQRPCTRSVAWDL